MIKKYKSNLIIIGVYLLLVIIFSILNYLCLPHKISRYLVLLTTIALVSIFSFKEGKKRINKGYLGGIKTSLLFILLCNLIDILLIHADYDIKRFIYYIILLLIGILTSIIGINKKAS